MKRVFYWQTDTAGCFHYRIATPASAIDVTRYEVTWGAPGADIHDYDVVVGQRLTGENPLWRRLCDDPNVMTVYDADDDLTNLDPENTVPYSLYAPVASATRDLIHAADVVTTCTPHVTRAMRALNSDVVELPICVPDYLFELPRSPRHDDRVVIGYAGSAFHAQDWEALAPILGRFGRARPQVRFVTIGADYMSPHTRPRVYGWSTVPDYYRVLDQIDIGVAPLRRTNWNLGKSHTKVLEYAARGVVPVAQDWGQYSDYLVHGHSGYLVADDGTGWEAALEAALDPERRQLMVARGAERARQRWAISANIWRWHDLFDGVWSHDG